MATPSGSARAHSSAPTSSSAASSSASVGSGRRQAEVVGERAVEHVHLLGDEADGAARRRGPELGERHAADRHRAVRRRVEPGHDLGERRLAGARHADEREPLAGRELEVHGVEHGMARDVGVPDAATRTAAADPSSAGAGGAGGSAGGGRAATPTSRASAASARWASSTVPSTTLNWSNSRTNSSAPAVAPPTESASARTSRKPAASTAAVPTSSAKLSREKNPVETRIVRTAAATARGRAIGDARQLDAGEVQRAHGARAADDVEQRLRALAAGDALRAVHGVRAPQVPAQRGDLDGDAEQAGQRDPHVDRREPDEREDDGERGAGERGERLDHRLRDDRDVVADAREEIAAARALHPRGGQPQRAVDDLLAQVGEHRLADTGDEREAQRGQDRLADRHDGQPGAERRDRARVAPRGHAVDDLAEQQRSEQAGRRGREQHEPATAARRRRGRSRPATARRTAGPSAVGSRSLTRAPPRDTRDRPRAARRARPSRRPRPRGRR